MLKLLSMGGGDADEILIPWLWPLFFRRLWRYILQENLGSLRKKWGGQVTSWLDRKTVRICVLFKKTIQWSQPSERKLGLIFTTLLGPVPKGPPRDFRRRRAGSFPKQQLAIETKTKLAIQSGIIGGQCHVMTDSTLETALCLCGPLTFAVLHNVHTTKILKYTQTTTNGYLWTMARICHPDCALIHKFYCQWNLPTTSTFLE